MNSPNALLVFTSAFALQFVGAQAGEVLRPVKIFTGIIAVEDARDVDYPRLEILRSETEFENFRKRLPAQSVSKQRPAPKNKDRLLRLSPADFSKQFAVALIDKKLDWATVHNIELSADKLTITAEFPPELSARPAGTGSYTLMVFPKLKPGTGVVLAEGKKRDAGVARISTTAGKILEALSKAEKDGGKEAAQRTLAFAKQNALSQRPSPAAWEILIRRGILRDGMKYADVVELLGHSVGMPKLGGFTQTTVVWYPRDGNLVDEGSRALRSTRARDGTLSGWSVVVLKK